MITRIRQESFLELLEHKMALRLSYVRESLQKCLPKFTSKRNLTAMHSASVLIPEYGQSNATLVFARCRKSHKYVRSSAKEEYNYPTVGFLLLDSK